MKEARLKRHRSEKEAKKILKKLRRDAEKEKETQQEPVQTRRVYGAAPPPSTVREEAQATPVASFIGPEVPEFFKEASPEPEEEAELVGPELPEDWEKSEKERQEGDNGEVERILTAVEKTGFVDPYEILGISADDASDAAVKKAYWRRSLLVHPDKNPHPQAQKAFQALNQAWKDVASPEHRLSTARKKEDREFQRQAEINVKKQQRQQEWTNVMQPGAAKSGGGGVQFPTGREEWMTKLPELRRKPAIMKQVNQTSFSRKEYADVTETPSTWTEGPQQRPSAAPIGPTLEGSCPLPREPVAKKRASLVEQHQRRQAEESSRTTAKNKAKGSQMTFQYRPFDREKDLDVKQKGGKDFDSMLKNVGSLNGRFASRR